MAVRPGSLPGCGQTVTLNAAWVTVSDASAENTPREAGFPAAGNDAALKYLPEVASCRLG